MKQTNQSVPEAQPIPAPEKPNKLLTALVVLVLLLLGTTGYLAYQNYQLRQQLAQVQTQPSPSPTSSPSSTFIPLPTPDETANWKTYTNNEFGISFKYLEGAEPEEEAGTPKYIVIKYELNKDPYKSYGIRVGIIGTTENITFDEYTQDYYEESVRSTADKCLETAQTTPLVKTTLSGKTSYTFQQLDCHNTDTTIYISLKDDDIFYVAASATGDNKKENLEIAKQILSTFKFLD